MTVHLKDVDVQAAQNSCGTDSASPPRVSIGLPVFNGRNYIERAVKSLLAQSLDDFELIILDNASTDGTYEFARTLIGDPRIRAERNNRNIGAIGNFAKVLSLARGDYFMWAAVDDQWEPEFVARLAAELDRHPEAGVAMSATRRVREDGSVKDIVRFAGSDNPEHMGPLRLALELGSPRKWSFFIYGLFRRPLLQRAVRYFPEGGAPDRILLAQIALHSGFRYVDEILYQRQLHNALHEERYPKEAYSRVVAMGLRGDLHFLRSLSVSLLRSHVVPLRRKIYAPLIVARFAAVRFGARLAARRVSMDLAATLKATQRQLAEATRQVERHRRTIASMEEAHRSKIASMEEAHRSKVASMEEAHRSTIASLEDREAKLTQKLDKQQKKIAELKERELTRAEGDDGAYPRFRTYTVQGASLRLLCRSAKEARRIKGQFTNETGTFDWLAQALLPDDVFFDIGANAGVFAIFAGWRIGPTGRVYAFEPHLTNAAALLTNVESNGLSLKVQVSAFDLSDRDEVSVFQYDSLSRGARTLVRAASAEGEPFDPVATELKHVCRLDTLLEAGLIGAPTVVRMDAGGREAAVIVGMERLLQSAKAPRSVQIAVRPTTSNDIIGRMGKAGYGPLPGGTAKPYRLEEPIGEFPGSVIFARR